MSALKLDPSTAKLQACVILRHLASGLAHSPPHQPQLTVPWHRKPPDMVFIIYGQPVFESFIDVMSFRLGPLPGEHVAKPLVGEVDRKTIFQDALRARISRHRMSRRHSAPLGFSAYASSAR